MGSLSYRFWRVLRWGLLALLALALLAAGAMVVVWWPNRHDEPLRPEVARLPRFDAPTPEALRRNGYFMLMGLGAPDPLAASLRLLQAQKQDYEQFQRTGQHGVRAHAAGVPKFFRIGALSCDAQEDDCYAFYLRHAAAIRAKLAEYAPLTERYLSVLDLQVYEEEAAPDMLAIRWPQYAPLSELVSMRAALLLAEGHTDEALALLERNARLHQRLLAGARTQAGAMMALEADLRQQRLISSAAPHLPALTAAYAERVSGLLQSTPAPLALPVSMATPMEGGIHWTVNQVKSMFLPPFLRGANGSLPWLDRLMRFGFDLTYLPHATQNLAYSLQQENIRLARLPADHLTALRIAAARQVYADAISVDIWPLRNFGGRWLMAFGGPELAVSAIQLGHDIEGHRRLARLQIAALHERVPLGDMVDWLAKQPPELCNPYTLQPMGWDARTQSLVFDGRQPQSQNPEPSHIYRVRLTLAPDATQPAED